jgi:hypothetical protein
VFEQWRDCYSSAVKAFIAKSKEKKGKWGNGATPNYE